LTPDKMNVRDNLLPLMMHAETLLIHPQLRLMAQQSMYFCGGPSLNLLLTECYGVDFGRHIPPAIQDRIISIINIDPVSLFFRCKNVLPVNIFPAKALAMVRQLTGVVIPTNVERMLTLCASLDEQLREPDITGSSCIPIYKVCNDMKDMLAHGIFKQVTVRDDSSPTGEVMAFIDSSYARLERQLVSILRSSISRPVPPSTRTNWLAPFLNEEQLAVINNIRNRRLTMVNAPPGTGKSHTMVYAIYDELLAGGNVLVLTPTNAARNRVKTLLGDQMPVALKPTYENSKPFMPPRVSVSEFVSALRENHGHVVIRNAQKITYFCNVKTDYKIPDGVFDLIIWDEMGMQDTKQFTDTLRCFERLPRMVLLGDTEQLTPVAGPDPFSPLLASKLDSFTLTINYRSASIISRNVQRVREQRTDFEIGEDWQEIECTSEIGQAIVAKMKLLQAKHHYTVAQLLLFVQIIAYFRDDHELITPHVAKAFFPQYTGTSCEFYVGEKMILLGQAEDDATGESMDKNDMFFIARIEKAVAYETDKKKFAITTGNHLTNARQNKYRIIYEGCKSTNSTEWHLMRIVTTEGFNLHLADVHYESELKRGYVVTTYGVQGNEKNIIFNVATLGQHRKLQLNTFIVGFSRARQKVFRIGKIKEENNNIKTVQKRKVYSTIYIDVL